MVRSFVVILVSVLLVSCSGKTTYPPLGYIVFGKMPIAQVVTLREEMLAYVKSQKCVEHQSTQTKFFEVKDLGKKATQFVDIYICNENIYVFMNQLHVTISFREGEKVKTQKWKVLGQGIEALVAKKDPKLKMIWNEANIKANVVGQ